MNRVRLLLAIGALALPAMPGAALACDVPGRNEDQAAIERHARDLVQRSSAIIDAEVVEMTGIEPAQLRAIRALKGPPLAIFRVAFPDNCHIGFIRVGERVRIVLAGGPDVFRASGQDNGLDYSSPASRRRLEAALDALLGAPRPPDVGSPGG